MLNQGDLDISEGGQNSLRLSWWQQTKHVKSQQWIGIEGDIKVMKVVGYINSYTREPMLNGMESTFMNQSVQQNFQR